MKSIRMTKKIRNLVGRIITELIEKGIKVDLRETPKIPVPGEISYNGWFTHEPPEFVVAIGKGEEEWLPIMLHEYCHFRQWVEKDPKWIELQEFEDKWEGMDWEAWLKGKEEYPISRIRRWTRLSQAIELDCEKRVVKLIKKEGLQIDIEDYIMRANTYVYFYNLVPGMRKWYDKKAPYEIPEICHLMPPFFMDDYTKTPPGFRKLVMDLCINT